MQRMFKWIGESKNLDNKKPLIDAYENIARNDKSNQ